MHLEPITLTLTLTSLQLCDHLSDHLAQGIKGSAITSLQCAAAPYMAPALSSGRADTKPHPHPCSQRVHAPPQWPRHLHHRMLRQGVPGAKGQRHHLSPVRRRTIAPALMSDPAAAPIPNLTLVLLAAWKATTSAASAKWARAPTPPSASPSCARGSGAVPLPRSSALPHRTSRSLIGPCWHNHPPPASTLLSPLLAAYPTTSSAASALVVMAPTPPRASASCSRGLRAAPSPRSSAPPLSRQAPLAPAPTLTLACSLGNNQLCGIGKNNCGGTYTTEGIIELCEGLRGSAITSLECATAP